MRTHVSVLSFFSIFLIVLVFTLGTSTQIANAQEGVSINTFKPSASVNSLFELQLPRPKKHLKWSVGGLLQYAHEPVRMKVTNEVTGDLEVEDYPVKMRMILDLNATLGLFDFAAIGFVLPVVAYQMYGSDSRSDADDFVATDRNIQPAGLGDPRIELKVRFLEVSIFQMGAAGILTLPIGHYASSGNDFLGTKYPTFEPKLLASLSPGPVTIGLNVGFLLREGSSMANYHQTHALTWNAGMAYDIFDFYKPGGLRILLEMNGEGGVDFDSLIETPMEILAGIRYRTRQDLVVTGGIGPGTSSAVGTPAFRVFVGLTYDPIQEFCPLGKEDYDGFEDDDLCLDADNDKDTILDVDDDCPNDPEDFDKFEDEDGCPELDNDKDTILDKDDKCPMIPEDFDKFEDEDGCPEEGPKKAEVKVTESQILISSKIYFDFDKSTIKEISYPIIDAVAQAMKDNPEIKKLRVEGHTDNEGTEDYNNVLSKERAQAVVIYLVSRGGIDAERLAFEGYGFSKPKASNETEEGRAINRRVEFTILERAEP